MRHYTTKFAKALHGISNLDTRMVINAYIMGLKPSSHLETLSLQRVATIPELLSRAKQYIEPEGILLAKWYSSIDCYPNIRKGKKQRFEKRNYYEGESSVGPQRNTWKPHHDNEVFQTTIEAPTSTPPPSQGKSEFF